MEELNLVQKKNNKIIFITLGCIFLVLISSYLFISFYFTNRFSFKSYINGINVSGKTPTEVEEMLISDNNYMVQINCRDNNSEIIQGRDIDLKYKIEGKIQDVKDKQSPFGWGYSVFKRRDYNIDLGFSYDEAKLKDKYDALSIFNEGNIIEPKDASIAYESNGYVIKDEILGNKIKKDQLFEEVKEAIKNKKEYIDVEKDNLYEEPKIFASARELTEAKDELDKYIKAKITYTRGNEVVSVLDGDRIKDWLSLDDAFQVTFNEDNVGEYVRELDDIYDTVGVARSFNTSLGTTIQVSGGDYGWIMDNGEEIKELTELVKNGNNISREPIYLQKGFTYDNNDIGNTYVEINLTNQYLWFYVDGKIIAEGSVVTGNGNSKYATPAGVYTLDYKSANATLRGPGYACPVSFWMPFNGDIGIHDATWRGSFGGQIYMGDGSHGCVNTPYNLSQAIFNNISAGTPVVCYH